MNNFSELQATKINLPVVIVLDPIYQTQAPCITVTAATQVLFHGNLLDSITLTWDIDLLRTFDISIELNDKNDQVDHTSAVIVSQLTIDSHNLVPQWSHLAQYTNEKNYNLPTTHLGFNGNWKITVDKPFYQWWHQVTGQGWLLTPCLKI